MGFTKKQKISIIISLWLYFLWIVSICFTMSAHFKGNFINCIIVGGVGCVFVLLLYIILFSGAYYVPKTIKLRENRVKIRSIYRTGNITAIYICIAGFFSLSLSMLLLDKEKLYATRLAWLIIVSALFLIEIAILCIFTYRRITSTVRTFALQEKNDGLLSQ